MLGDVGHTLGMAQEHTSAKKRRRTAFATKATAVVAALSCLGVAGSSSADEYRDIPGLPQPDGPGAWVGPRATGINYIDRAKQWIRLPPLIIGAWIPPSDNRSDTSCGRLGPYNRTLDYAATGHFRSSRGASDPWGKIGPFVTRTVAFGNIPVEAAVEVRQARDDANLPVGFDIKQRYGELCAPLPQFPDVPGRVNYRWESATVDGQIDIALVSLKIDGVDLKLTKRCRTRELGTIALTSREYNSQDPANSLPGAEPVDANIMTTPYFVIPNGGRLDGAVDIPPFAGCVTRSGEDVSKLLTAAISGPGNAVTMRTEGLKGDQCLAPDIATGPGESCGPLGDLDFP